MPFQNEVRVSTILKIIYETESIGAMVKAQSKKLCIIKRRLESLVLNPRP